MKILFINTEDSNGGAAVVMRRIMTGLEKKYATQNRLIVKIKRGKAGNTEAILTGKFEIYSEKIIDRLSRSIGALYQYFPFSSKRILATVNSFRPDVINLHNTQSGFFATPLLKELSKQVPVVWTLHDMWSFTGNSAHTFGNNSWKQLKNDRWLTRVPPSIGINTGSYLLRQKRKVYRESDITIVTPSLWLKNLAKQSPVFEDKKIHQVYNGVDTTVFYNRSKETTRSKLGLPLEAKTIMFSSNFLQKNNPWKGGTDLLTILKLINGYTDEKITLLMLGEGKLDGAEDFANFNIFYGGYINNEELMSEYLSAADLFIYPTRADNLPNVLVESIACGTPCVTFDIGGNREIIKHNYNGIIINPFDFDLFARETVNLIHDEKRMNEFSFNCIQLTNERFRSEDMIDAYYNLFLQRSHK